MNANLRKTARDVKWLAIEVSTTKIRLQCHSELGEVLWQQHIAQAMSPAIDGLFQKPSEWLLAVETLISCAKQDGLDLSTTSAIGICSTTPTLVAMNRSGRLVDDKARMWADPHRLGCLNDTGTNTGLMKMAYLVRSRSEHHRFRAARYYADAGPYLAWQLTGTLVSGAAMLSQKFARSADAFDLTGLELLEDGEVDAMLSRIPSKVIQTGDVVGALSRAWCAKLGTKSSPAVLLCGYDSVAGVFGANVRSPSSTVVFSVGTSATIYKCVSSERKPGTIGAWAPVSNMLPGGHGLISGGFEAGVQSIDLLHEDLRLTCHAAKDTELEQLAQLGERTCGSNCLSLPFGGVPLRSPLPGVVLPTIVSCECPVPRREVTLTAMRRGIACFFNYCLRDLAIHGERTTSVHIVGGGTQSPSFCQLIADLTRCPLRRFCGSTAANGAALMVIRRMCGESHAIAAAASMQAMAELVLPSENSVRQEFCSKLYANFSQRLKNELALATTSIS
jgi:sugar (pentulose or hexulose) kinase